MTLKEAMHARHSVRAYVDKPIDQKSLDALTSCINECNAQGDLNIQLVTDEPNAFGKSLLAHYGKFSGVKNYIAMVGKKGKDLDEKIGYYGEKIVLLAQTLGLNTCWVALTFKKIKNAFKVNKGEKLAVVISVGYGTTQGVKSKSKPLDKVCDFNGKSPAWFLEGVSAALLAPTAINQQKFFFIEEGGTVAVKAGVGPCAKIDLGIVKYHFEIAAGKENFKWKE